MTTQSDEVRAREWWETELGVVTAADRQVIASLTVAFAAVREEAQTAWRRCPDCEYEWRVALPADTSDDCPICTLIEAQDIQDKEAEAALAQMTQERDALKAENVRLREVLEQIAVLNYGADHGLYDHQVVARCALIEGGQP